MNDDKSDWNDIPSLDDLQIDWEYEAENPLGKRANSRLTIDDLRQCQEQQDMLVKLVSERGQLKAYVVDISQGGVCLRTKLSHSGKSDLVKLGFILGQRKIISRGRIKHVRQENEWTILGIEFVGLTEENEKFIGQLYSSINIKGGRKI